MALDATSPDNELLLKNIQGNILKGHGREHAFHIFIKFDPTNKIELVKWIISLVDRVIITSAKKQLDEREAYRISGVSGDIFGSFYLSYPGYENLGINSIPQDECFGKLNSIGEFKYSESSEALWANIHAMLLLAHDDLDELMDKVNALKKEINEFATVAHIEYGCVMRNKNGEGIEHFGYVDGISQPLFLEDDIRAYRKNNPGAIYWDPEADINLVLTQDMPDDEHAKGSFLVFAKLEQNIPSFKQARNTLIREIKLPNNKMNLDFAGALLMGRHKDGTPVTLSNVGVNGGANVNNFDYGKDDVGSKCPVHAHIRKANPRGTARDAEESLAQERGRRIARRGIPYGTRTFDPATQQITTNGVGLLFMSYQASIENQFKHIVTEWIMKKDFPTTGDGIDTILAPYNSIGQFSPVYDKEPLSKISVNGCVKFIGGGYFFAPSIPFLKSLKY